MLHVQYKLVGCNVVHTALVNACSQLEALAHLREYHNHKQVQIINCNKAAIGHVQVLS